MRKIIIISLVLYISIQVSAQNYTLCDKWVDCGNSCELLDPYYSDGVTFTWTGGSINGKAHGKGVAKKYKNGVLESTYEGEYKNGIREGRGIFTHADGTVKEGTFVNGQLMGQGTGDLVDGNEYEGCFINYRMHGNGKLKYGNGTVFEGFMVSDSPYTGKITYYDGTVIYIQAGEKVDKIKEKKSDYSPRMGVVQTEYFDSDWNRCAPKDAAYYRRVTYKAPNTPDGIVKDFYISGRLQSTFTAIYINYADEGKNFHEGKAVWYYEDGSVQQERYYYNNRTNGPETLYYKSGQVKTVANFKYGVLDGEAIEYNEYGAINSLRLYTNGELKDGKYLWTMSSEDVVFVHEVDFGDNPDYWNYSGPNGSITVQDGRALLFEAYPERQIRTGLEGNIISSAAGGAGINTLRSSKDSEMAICLSWGYKDDDNLNFLSIYKDRFKYASVIRGQQISGNDYEQSPYIDDEVNTLSFLYDKEKIHLFINQKEVYSDNRPPEVGNLYVLTALNVSEKEQDAVAMGGFSYMESADEDEAKKYVMSATPSTGWRGSGSGFFVSEDGYIATNHHVIEDASTIEVTFQRNGVTESHAASVVLSDRQNDLAILKIDDDFAKMKPIPYNFSSSVKETGSEVFTLGYPIASVMGDEVKFTDGKISSKTGIQGDVTKYQITVPIQPGNSGGPLFDTGGNVVGITSSALNKDYYRSENVNYAVKFIYLQSLIDSLPVSVTLQRSAPLAGKPLTEMVKSFSDYMVYIKVK